MDPLSTKSTEGNQNLMLTSSGHCKVIAFLETLSREKKHSGVRLHQLLTIKKNQRSRKLQQRRKLKERIRKMVQDLQTAEAEIDTLDNEIRDIEFGIQTATDADEDV